MGVNKGKVKKAIKKPSVTKAGKVSAITLIKCKNPPLKIGTVGTYGELQKTKGDGSSDRDHMPSYKALEKRATVLNKKKPLTSAQKGRVKRSGKAIVLPKAVHKQGRTYGGKNTAVQSDMDSKNLAAAGKSDIHAYKGIVDPKTFAVMQKMPLTNIQYDKTLLACLTG